MRKKSKLTFLKRSILLLFILGLMTIHFFVPRLISEIGNPVVSLIKRNRNVAFQPEKIKNYTIERKTVTITSFDQIKLSGRLTYSTLDSVKGTVILLHGIRGNKDHFLELSDFLSSNGYHSFALDLRAHGDSEGQFCSFGVKEKKDIQKVLDFLIEEEQLSNIGIWGQSLGGAIGLQTMGIDERLEYGIIESAFSDFKNIVNDYFQLNTGFSYTKLSNYLATRAGEIGDFDAVEASPVTYCEKIKQPILMVHGSLDDRISITYGKHNFSKLLSKDKKFITIDSANHTNVWKVGGQPYFDQIISFLDRQSEHR